MISTNNQSGFWHSVLFLKLFYNLERQISLDWQNLEKIELEYKYIKSLKTF